MPAGPHLELTWPNKDKFLLAPKDDDGKPVWVERDHPAAHEVRLTRAVAQLGEVDSDNPYADNTVFVGDSLDALRVMCEVPEYAERYRGKVKLVYIDPPFNTGQTFTHYDDWMEHSVWLSFMRERLLLIRQLLAPDGSVWVHLDDAEVHRMRCLLDEVFGAQNFVATVVWQKKTSRDNRAAFSVTQDQILAYSRRPGWRHVRNRLPDDGDYTNPDHDPRGPWRSTPMSAQAGHATASQFYPITTPTGAVHTPPPGRCWTYTQERFTELLEQNLIYWPRNGSGIPRVKRFPHDSQGLVPFTLWPAAEVGENATAVRELRALLGPGETFDTPKPETLLERILHIATNPGDLVVDCFAGSGTTAAVAHKMGRRWATVEVTASTVDDFIIPRLTKVVEGTDPGGVTEATGWAGGGGFRVVAVEPSLYEVGPRGLVLLRDGVAAADLARAMCGQLRYTHTPDQAPLVGRRGRMRLAVLPGVVGDEEIDELLGHLEYGERLTVAAGGFTPGTPDRLAEQSRGSRTLKLPRDVLTRTLRRADLQEKRP